MKKIKNKIICIFLVLIFLSSIIIFLSTESNEHKNVVYNIDAIVSENKLCAEMTIEYTNNENFNIKTLYFSLYPNAFKSEDNLENIVVSDLIFQAYPDGFDSGYIDIKEVMLDNKNAEYFFENAEQILAIKTQEIKPKETLKIKISFEEKLPFSPMRFGYGNNTYNFGNWYPVLCPFVNGEAYKCIYTSNGDPFFSEVADYNVTLTIPSEYKVSSSGKIIKQDILNPIDTKWTISGKNIRDFAFIISNNFKVQSTQIDDIIIYSYYLSDDLFGEFSLEVAKDAVQFFNEKFGKYPYESLSIAESDFCIGGMEYPNVVFINTELYNESAKDALEEVIVHEIAHQWFYGTVGNNQIDEPWLDEGLTQYSVALYFENKYGNERYKSFLNEGEIYSKVVFDILNEKNISFNKKINKKSYEFEHWLLYDAITYDVTALMLDELRNKIGDSDFFAGLKYYYENNKFIISTEEIFIRDMSKSTKKNIEQIVRPWLSGKIYWG